MTVLNQTLVLTALILGLFLLYNFTMSVFLSFDCQYNVGCYQVPHSLNHTSQIKGRLEAIENITHQSKSLAYHYRSIVRNQSDFHSKSLMAGRSFDRYVMQFKEQQDYRLQDREILYAINEAEKSYLSCKNEVESNAIRIGCLSTWKQYQQCFESVGVVHQQINGLLNKQKEIQKKIRSEIQQPKEPDPQSRPEINAQKIYNQSMLQNQNALKVLKDRLSLAEFKLRSAKEQKDKSEDRVVSKEHSYSECWQNRRIYKHCEEITNQVKNISTGTLKQLKQQIQAKQKLLQEMQEMMLRMGKGETRKMPEHWTQMYQEHVKQLKQMMVDYIQNEQIQRKACGCSQQEERLLALELQKEKSNLLQLTIQIQNVLLEVKEIRQLINQKQIEKEKIIADYQKALKDYQISVPPASQSHLIKLRKELDQNRLQILQTQKYYQQIGENCNAIKQQLSSLLFDLNKVEECISKKDFLIQLRRQTVTYRHPDRSLVKLMQTKRELALALAAFDQL